MTRREESRLLADHIARENNRLQYLKALRDFRLADADVRLARSDVETAESKGPEAVTAAKARLKKSEEQLSRASNLVATLEPRTESSDATGMKSGAGVLGQIDVSDLQPPGKASPLFFATDSALGLKIGFEANVPTSFVFGFNRKELALAPVTAQRVAGGGYEVAMPSVLAAVNSQASAETDKAGLKYQQYFATGKAATYLALQKDVREAFSRQLLPADAQPEISRPISMVLLAHIYSELGKIAASDDDPERKRSAERLIAELDIAAGKIEPDVEIFERKQPAQGVDANVESRVLTSAELDAHAPGTPPPSDFERMQRYWHQLRSSIDALTSLIEPYESSANAVDDAKYQLNGAAVSQKQAWLKWVRSSLEARTAALEAAVNKRNVEAGNPMRRAREFVLEPSR